MSTCKMNSTIVLAGEILLGVIMVGAVIWAVREQMLENKRMHIIKCFYLKEEEKDVN